VHVVVDVAGDERQVPFRFFASSEFFSMLYSKVTLPSLSTTSVMPWCFSLQVLCRCVLVLPDSDSRLEKSG